MKNLSSIAAPEPTAELIVEVEEQGVDVTAPYEDGTSLLMRSLSNTDLLRSARAVLPGALRHDHW